MSFYTSLTGLKNAQTDLGVISHNIANAETGGFKKSDTSFADIVAVSVLTDPSLTMGIGSRVSSIKQSFSLGPIEQTGSALDVAINGEGFFTMAAPGSGKVSVTRAGNFDMDENGYVVNNQGDRLQVFPVDANGVPTSTTTTIDALAPPTNTAGAAFSGIAVKNTGEVAASYDDGTIVPIGVVAVAGFMSPTGLRQIGSASWEPSGQSGAIQYGIPGNGRSGLLLSGALERSNVDIAEELVGLITAQRNFQANAKAIDTATQISQSIINIRT
ncbi:flagellar hook-basal body complex protein [Porphyrobacter algicida]|uniref:Flagellar hook protein FlgE n=1 Tax=Qipengyuania algicida TaxID=1836209 RepID=A0A845AB24_9SPHN|nr:flagellar hook-basal body complex protein [Qipengyuania algicida]MXP27622.1 flagellar hook-basal body complex protein [Qipengyuania algicida]